MSKANKYSLIGLITLIIAGFLALTFTIDSIVSSGIEEVGSNMTGTTVTVDDVSISPFSGSGTISGFRVANPDGYSREAAMEIESLSITLDLFTVFSDEIIVNSVSVTGAVVTVEQTTSGNNLRDIMTHINNLPEGEASDSKLIIEQFLLENSSAAVYSDVGGERSATVDIPTIELQDVGRQSDMDTAEDVIRQIAEEVADESLQAALEGGLDRVRDAIQDLFD